MPCDSRVTIVRSSNGSFNFGTSVITTIIPLFEDDDGFYTCYLITNESKVSVHTYTIT